MNKASLLSNVVRAAFANIRAKVTARLKPTTRPKRGLAQDITSTVSATHERTVIRSRSVAVSSSRITSALADSLSNFVDVRKNKARRSRTIHTTRAKFRRGRGKVKCICNQRDGRTRFCKSHRAYNLNGKGLDREPRKNVNISRG